MALSYTPWTGPKVDGDTLAVDFEFLSRDHVSVVLDDDTIVPTSAYEWTSNSIITCLAGFPENAGGRVARYTPRNGLRGQQQGSGAFNWTAANENDLALLYIAQETADAEDDREALTEEVLDRFEEIEENSERIDQAADDAEAAAATATTKAAEAAVSKTGADTANSNAQAASATATTKASEASASASTATTKANEATTATSTTLGYRDTVAGYKTIIEDYLADVQAYADDASADALATAADRVATAALLDLFDDRMLGSKSSAPTLDNDGNALVDGAVYFNTSTKEWNVWDLATTSWIALASGGASASIVSFSPTGDLIATNVQAAIAELDTEKLGRTEAHNATQKTTLADSDEFGVQDSATSYTIKRTTLSNIASAIWTRLGALISGGTAKATPTTSDILAISDQAASSATKQTTIGQLFDIIGGYIAGTTAKGTLATGDTFLIADSAASNANKSATFTSLLNLVWTNLGVKIAGGTQKATPTTSDKLAVADAAASNATKYSTIGNIFAILGAYWASLTAKATVVDADGVMVADSAASNANKWVTFTNLWANYLKAKADALYQPLATILTSLAGLANASGVLTNNGSGGLSWGAAGGVSGTWTLIGTLSTASGNSWVQALGGTYKQLRIVLSGVVLSSSTGDPTLRLQITDDGTTYGSTITVSGAFSNSAGVFNGVIHVMNTAQVGTTKLVSPEVLSHRPIGSEVYSFYCAPGSEASENGITHSIKITPSGQNGAGGSIYIYGMV